MMDKFRKKYKEFVFENFTLDYSKNILTINYKFKIEPGISFSPKIRILGIPKIVYRKLDVRVLNNLAFNLGMVESMSYWKTTCARTINIRCGALDNYQIRWWKKVVYQRHEPILF